MKPQATVLLLTIAACGGPAVPPAGMQPAGAESAAAATITPGDMRARIAFLASDALRGRDTPSQGLEVAAAYIASEFARLGLATRPDSATYYQRYPFVVRTLERDRTRATVSTRGETTTLTFGSDMFASAGATAAAEGELVFVGLHIPEGRDLTRPVPVVYVSGTMGRAWRTAVLNARRLAHAAGARALVVILDPTVTTSDIRQRAAASATTMSVTPIASTVFARYDAAREIFRRAGEDLDALVARARNEPLARTLSHTTIDLAIPVSEVVHHPPNVLGIVTGSDPELRDTYVVLSAHMDHVGVGRPNAHGDSIYNGADDDASGTSAVLEVAEAFAAMAARPARSIIFLAVSGEEKGLLGSQYFAEHPVVPLSSIVANINLDMIARNAPDSIVALGQDYTSLGPLVQEVVRAHPELRLTVAHDIWPQERFFFRSDHFNFARKEIPAIFFFAGVHDDYHQPSDEVDRIDADKAARVAKLAYYLAHEIARRREPPRWTSQGLSEVRAMTR